MRRATIMLWIICLCVLATSCHATVRRVAATASGNADGTSWANAYDSIQTAINDSSSGDEVWIKGYSDGTTVYAISGSITLKDGVSIKGGYVGDDTNDGLRDTNTYITTISGANTNGCVIYASSITNTASTVIEYCTITGGSGELVPNYTYGGGIYCTSASPTISHCRICNNSAQYGGGIYADSNSSPLIEYCTINSNGSNGYGFGGGIYLYKGTCRYCEICSNTISSGNGGGVCLGSYGSAVFQYNTVSSNRIVESNIIGCDSGGGVILSNTSASTVFTNNTIERNTGTWGGGISVIAPCDIVHNTIRYNTTSWQGGGIAVRGDARIFDNTISENNASGTYAFGAGLSIMTGNSTIARNIISHNTSSYRGGGVSWSSYNGQSSSLYSNIIVGNSASSYGSGVYTAQLQPSDVFANNTIISDGSSGTTQCLVCLYAPSSAYLYNNIIGNSTLCESTGICKLDTGTYYSYNNCLYSNYTNYYGNPANGTGSDIKNINPGFKSNDYHLDDGSPCIDAGLNGVVGTGWTDIDGDQRIMGGFVDIGADEYNDSTIPSLDNASIACPSCIKHSPFTVSYSNVTDAGSGIYSVTLWYKKNNASDWTSYATNVNNAGFGSFNFTPNGEGTYYFALSAVDNSGNDTGTPTSSLGQTVYDISSPTVGIISPSGSEWHLASGQNTIQFAGTAADADSGVVLVEVKIDSGQWQPATYNAGNYTWSYNWQNPQSGTIWARATDFAGNVATVSRDIVVSTVTITYVDGDAGNNNNNGSSWTLAKKTVAGALSTASSGEIWVKQGLYSERITLMPGVALYGGFTATENSREQRNWSTNKTILDGKQGGSVVTIPYGTTSATTIDGFTIRNGSANCGGGICASGGSATITNCIVRGNSANSDGGGIWAQQSTLKLAGNIFVSNTSANGGAIFYNGSGGQIANNTIIKNTASSNGGGICFNSLSTLPTLTNNIIAFNNGGGIYKSSGSLSLIRNDVYGNNKNSKYEYSWTTTYPVDGDLTPTPPEIPYIDYDDFHIAGNSPCHDPQNTSLAVPMESDIDAESRPYNNTTVDIGADEWNGTEPQVPIPGIIYVKPGGNDNNDGTKWDTAVATIQKGIDIANATGNCEVWVAAGNYAPTATINLKPGVRLYGGFAGTETTREQRNWKTNKTVLDGSNAKTVVCIQSNGTVANTIIDGFTIQHGSANNGGGISAYNASATIANNIIRANTGTYGGGGLGGSYFPLNILGNVFVRNTSGSGAGIYLANVGGQVANNTIIGNDGVGIYFASNSTFPVLSNNIVAFNSGNGIYKSSGNLSLIKNDVYGNKGKNGNYEYSWTTTYPVGNDLIPIDPGIPHIDYGDWHIAEDSTCHDPQDTVLAIPMDKDIDGESRPYNNTTVDIGADEWNGNEPQVPILDVIYVKPSTQGGSDSNSGKSWDTAVATIQKGIDLAYNNSSEVWVAAGTYTGASGKATMRSFVKLYGGFAVGDGSKSARNWKNNPTILDGNGSGSVITISNVIGCTIDGFTIRNGAGYYSTYYYGGGLYCSNATATIMNNIIRANNADSSSSYGGGLYAQTSTLTVAGNVFIDNKATSGGGIYYKDTIGTIANNTIISNSASTDGGGIYIYSGSPALLNNIVAFNTGGGIYEYTGATPTLTKDNVYGNSIYQYNWTAAYPVNGDIIPTSPGIPYIDYGDWHIAEDSTCHDPQDTVLAIPMDKDIDGESRPYNNTTVDIGADEWNGTEPQVPTTRIYYVKQDGNDSSDGLSWGNAVRSVQKGIDLAYGVGGGEVWVAAGKYTKTGSATTVANLKSFVKVYGGFAVGDSSKSARNWKINKTILDGGTSGAVVTAVNIVGCQIDGFIIRNGSGYKSGGGRLYGGGIYCSSASATITNNIVRANSVSGSTYYHGGGIYASGSTITVAGNVFVDNTAGGYGGGIYCASTGGNIANNTIISNNGVGIYLGSASPLPALSNNIVAFNAGGGIYKTSDIPTCTKNDIYGNTNYQYSWTTSYPVDSDLTPTPPGIPYIDYGDWHIAGDSLCRDPQGTILAVSMDKDLDVESRPYNNTTVDKGADEWNGAEPQVPIPDVIYVKPGGNDSNNGNSWDNAVATLQKGIDLAYITGNCEVWVAAGNYMLTSTITLKSGVQLYGGFAGTEAYREQRNWETNKTVLDGNDSVAVVSIQANSSAVNTIIDGFMIQRGSATSGAGISCSNASATIMHNKIMLNKVSSNGGGISCYTSSSMITNNWIIGNTATDDYGGFFGYQAGTGAGINLDHFSGSIINNTIAANEAFGDGGGVYAKYSTTAQFKNNLIAFNSSGVYVYDGDSQDQCWSKNYVYGNALYQYNWTETFPNTDICANADPKFLRPTNGDFHILTGSPCINAGDPVTNYIDIDDDSCTDGAVDIGADEWNGTDPTSSPTIVRVSPSGQDNNSLYDGSSWSLTKKTIQKAIDTVAVAGGGEVRVKGAPGTGVSYNEGIRLRPFVTVYGGFDENDLRDWHNNLTVIDASGKNTSTVTVNNGYLACAIDGFTIQHGASDIGGGIHCEYGSPLIEHNIIQLNNAANGGGIGCSKGAMPVIRSNIIKSNTATENGGGIGCSLARIVNNGVIGNTALRGAGIYCVSTNVRCDMINNTVAYNTLSSGGDCGGIYLDSVPFARIYNNIIASNAGSGIKSYSSLFKCNDVWGQTPNYDGVPDQTGSGGNISVDPLLDSINHLHIQTDQNGNDCKDKGRNDLFQDCAEDIDGDYRIQEGTIDIGADEILNCASEIIVFDPARTIGSPNADYTLTACVTNPVTHQPVSAGRHVDFQVTSGNGEILSITNGQVSTPPSSGWGETGTDGKITLILRAGSVFGRIILTASTQSICNSQISATSKIELGNRIGLAYDLCGWNKEYYADMVEDYLEREDAKYDDVAYSRIGSLQSGLQDSYDTVFVVMPKRDLNSSELSMLTSFVQSGRHKRVVLVGEYGQIFAVYNARLNLVATALGINSQFSTAYRAYDGEINRDRLCLVENSHYLMEGVVKLWCAATDEFSGWQGYARPLAYIYSAQTKPWIVEEDTLSTGSIVAMHDGSYFATGYNDSYDTVPEKNFKFLHNLCVKYPQ